MDFSFLTSKMRTRRRTIILSVKVVLNARRNILKYLAHDKFSVADGF